VRRPHFPDPDPGRPFDGDTLETADPALASMLTRAKQTLTERPRDEVASAHVAQMTQAARSRPAVLEPRVVPVAPRRGGMRTFRRALAGFALVMLTGATSMVGLAYAGVRLPPSVLTAFNDVGIHLPNQDQDAARTGAGTPSSSSQHGQDVKSIATTGPHGCVHGRAVSAAASVNRQDAGADAHRQSASHQTADPCAQAHHQSGSGSTSAGSQQSQGPSSTGTTSMQTHRHSGGQTSSTATHGRSGKSGNQGKGEGGSQQGDHPGASNSRGRAGQHGPR
jgi:hypothetical protein